MDKVLKRLETSMANMTPEVKERRKQDCEDFERRQRHMKIDELRIESNAPARHWGEHVKRGEQCKWTAMEKLIKGRLGQGIMIALIGERGNGKTQLGVELIRTNVHHLKSARFCTAAGFYMELKHAYKSSDESEKDVIDRFARYSLLVIDEIGKRSENDWENRLLYELLNRRYNSLKDTVLISNHGERELRDAIGPSLASRMNESGGLIECDWNSYRPEQE